MVSHNKTYEVIIRYNGNYRNYDDKLNSQVFADNRNNGFLHQGVMEHDL
jgi:hypothetical protein